MTVILTRLWRLLPVVTADPALESWRPLVVGLWVSGRSFRAGKM